MGIAIHAPDEDQGGNQDVVALGDILELRVAVEVVIETIEHCMGPHIDEQQVEEETQIWVCILGLELAHRQHGQETEKSKKCHQVGSIELEPRRCRRKSEDWDSQQWKPPIPPRRQDSEHRDQEPDIQQHSHIPVIGNLIARIPGGPESDNNRSPPKELSRNQKKTGIPHAREIVGTWSAISAKRIGDITTKRRKSTNEG